MSVVKKIAHSPLSLLQVYLHNNNNSMRIRFGASLTSNNASTSTEATRAAVVPAARRTASLTSPATRIIGFSEAPRTRDREQGKLELLFYIFICLPTQVEQAQNA